MGGKALGGVTDALGLTDTSGAAALSKKAAKQSQIAVDRLDAIDLPDIEKLKVALQSPELVGLLEAEQLDPTALEDIEQDPRLAEAQLQALRGLQERSQEGLTQADKFAIEEGLEQAAQQEKATRASIERDLAERGLADSGTALISKLQGSQASANRARDNARALAMQSIQSKQQALQNAGQLAGQIQGQDFSRQSQIAAAKDRIAQANAQNRQQVSGQNLAARQNIANQRANIQNQQQLYNKGLYQQQFQNQLSKAGAQNQATQNLANTYAQQAGAKAQADANTIGAVANVGAAFAKASDIRVKTDIEDGGNKVREMMDELTPYEYDYIGKFAEQSPERQVGVMAQDLEESDLGQQFVEEDVDGVKKVDYGKMGSTQLSMIADLHRRLKELEGKE